MSTEKSLTFVANCASETVQITMSESRDSFSYDSDLRFRDAVGNMKTTKVTFTYDKVGAVITPI